MIWPPARTFRPDVMFKETRPKFLKIINVDLISPYLVHFERVCRASELRLWLFSLHQSGSIPCQMWFLARHLGHFLASHFWCPQPRPDILVEVDRLGNGESMLLGQW